VYSQFKECLVAAAKSLKAGNDKRDAVLRTKEVEAEKKRSEDALHANEVVRVTLKKQVTQKRFMSAFQLEWTSAQHPPIVVCDGDTSVKDEIGKSKLSMPLILTNSSTLKAIYEELGDSHPRHWIDRWTESFPVNPKTKLKDRTSAPMTDKHYSSLLDPFMYLLNPVHLVADHKKVPHLDQACAKPWFYGYRSHMVDCSFEPDFLGTVRIQCEGVYKVLLVPAHPLMDKLDALAAPAAASPIERAKALILNATPETAKACYEHGVLVYTGTVDAASGPVTLVTPVGFLVCVSCLNNKLPSGIRKSFLQIAGA
jgi:hypothetical protein